MRLLIKPCNEVSLTRNYFLSNKKLKVIYIIWNIIFLLNFFFVVILSNEVTQIKVFVVFLLLFLFFPVSYCLLKYRKKNLEILSIRQALIMVLYTNNLYTTTVDSSGKKIIERSAVLFFRVTRGIVIVRAISAGDNFTTKVRDLDVFLEGALGYKLMNKEEYPNYVNYFFSKGQEKRLVLKNEEKSINYSLDIDLGFGVTYNPVKCPHILLAGGTGSGKSMFISFLIIEFYKMQSRIYICDPKNSDLGSLSHYLSEELVAYRPSNIARIMRIVVEEMNERYSHMRERKNFVYGANFVTHGYKPIWVIFDELGAFQAIGTDKASKAIIEEVMKGLKQIILLGRQAGVFVLLSAQQMRAENLSTDLRDNLGLRIALGANSPEGYRMVLGSSSNDLKPVDEIGAGYLYMQSSAKNTAQYYESPFFSKDYNFLEELEKYIS